MGRKKPSKVYNVFVGILSVEVKKIIWLSTGNLNELKLFQILPPEGKSIKSQFQRPGLKKAGANEAEVVGSK